MIALKAYQSPEAGSWAMAPLRNASVSALKMPGTFHCAITVSPSMSVHALQLKT
jgi:hypothetical protein